MKTLALVVLLILATTAHATVIYPTLMDQDQVTTASGLWVILILLWWIPVFIKFGPHEETHTE